MAFLSLIIAQPSRCSLIDFFVKKNVEGFNTQINSLPPSHDPIQIQCTIASHSGVLDCELIINKWLVFFPSHN